jgi:hypothetical protein
MDRAAVAAEIDAFIESNRDRCLWFVQPDLRPRTDDERRWLLGEILRRADRDTFARAGRLKRCLSLISKDGSAGS